MKMCVLFFRCVVKMCVLRFCWVSSVLRMFYLVIVFCWLSSSGHPASGIHIRKPSCLKKYEFSDHPWAAQVQGVFPGFEGLNVG